MTTDTDAPNVLDEWTFTVTAEKAQVMEERVRIILQPKPRWLPTFLWRRLLARLLYLEHS